MARREKIAAALQYLQEKTDFQRRLESATSLDQPTNQDAADVALEIGAGFMPGIGQAQAARDFERSRRTGDRLGQVLATVGMVPVVGGVAKAAQKAGKAIDKAIESRYFTRLESDYDNLKAEYSALPDSYEGKVLNTDVARELSPDYLADRTRSADVHEPASSFIKRLYAERLAQPTPAGKDPVILFTAGGTGAGKSSGVTQLRRTNPAIDRAELEYDTNMNGYESSKKKVDQALKSGRKVAIFYTYRDPVEALDQGALTRAMGNEAKYGSGRTVPLSEHLKTHIGARSTMEKLAKDYAGNPNFNLTVIDNTRGAGNAAISSLDNLPKLSENKVRDELRKTLEKARSEGRISEKVYRGFADY
jgi:hypothetical protein